MRELLRQKATEIIIIKLENACPNGSPVDAAQTAEQSLSQQSDRPSQTPRAVTDNGMNVAERRKKQRVEVVRTVVKALWNALRGRHKYGAMNGNQYAARRCSKRTRLTAAIFAHYRTIVCIKSISINQKNVLA